MKTEKLSRLELFIASAQKYLAAGMPEAAALDLKRCEILAREAAELINHFGWTSSDDIRVIERAGAWRDRMPNLEVECR